MGKEDIKVEWELNDIKQCLIRLLNIRDEEFLINGLDNNWEMLEHLDIQQYIQLQINVYFSELLKLLELHNDAHADTFKETTLEKTHHGNIKLPHPDTALDNVYFGNEFDKLILRIRNSNNVKLGPGSQLSDILLLTQVEFRMLKGVGKKYFEQWEQLKGLYELQVTECQKNMVSTLSETLLEEEIVENMSVTELGNILLEDIDDFLESISIEMQDIFQRRWGFVEKPSTLEELGLKYKVTRERIRQKEGEINHKLLISLRFSSENIWQVIGNEVNFKLAEKLEDLSSCFNDEKKFYEFLEFICGCRDIYSKVKPTIQLDLLNAFFARNGAPCDYTSVKGYLEERVFRSLKSIDCDNAIRYLVEKGRIRLDGEKIFPIYLKKTEAAACVLSNHSMVFLGLT